MTIDFHLENSRYTYSSRIVDENWMRAISSLVKPKGKIVFDVGCGGGIYSRVWSELGAMQVTGIDFSGAMLETACEDSKGIENVSFQVGDALSTKVESESADIVFERALIHHVSNLPACLREAYRLLKPGGAYLIQDRTIEDVKVPSSQSHIRGFLFEFFPKLLKFEEERRRSIDVVSNDLNQAGFINTRVLPIWEIRKRYKNFAELAEDIEKRKGRSILYELTDKEIQDLILYIEKKLIKGSEIVERDRWTIWYGEKVN